MPPETYNWDRRELRNHEGGGRGGGGGFGGSRWREQSFSQQNYHYYNNSNYPRGGGGGGGGGGLNRWGSEFRYRGRGGHGKQGSRDFYRDEVGHGLMASRPNEKMMEDESYRQRGFGRYSRVYRGSVVQKDWKAYSSEIDSQPDRSSRLNGTSDQRSVDVMPSHNSSTPSSDSINTRDQSLSKYQHESSDVVGSLGSAGQKLERENSLNSINWKPLKWTQSESLSVRTLGFSHSSSSKSMEPDSSVMKMELMQTNVDSVLSSPRAAAAAETANVVAEKTNSHKKPRVRWGEGLAKYEKKKVETSDDSGKNAATTRGSNLEPWHSFSSNLIDKSPKLVMVSECASPATTSSVACSSSPGLGENQLIKDGSTVHDSAYICNSPSVTQLDSDRSFNLEELDLTTISHLNSSIEELLQSDDPTVESSYVRSAAMNKLLLLKNNISKAVETTETEIDLLENELKLMISELESCNNHLYASSCVPVACLSKPNEDQSASSNAVLRSARLHVLVNTDIESKDDLVMNDADVDSPCSATSKFVEVPLSIDVSPPEMLREIEVTRDPDLIMSNVEMEPEIDHLVEEKPFGLSSDGIDSQLVGCSISSDDDSLNICEEDFSHELILASKRDCEEIASEATRKLLPSSGYHFDFSSVVEASCVQSDFVKERFSRKMYFYKLKEKILALKFKMVRHLWKEDMHILSLKKLRGKKRKKFDLSLWKANSSYQMQRPSIRSRCSSTGLSLPASKELLSYASRLLAEPPTKPLRSVLKMPSVIIDVQGKMSPRFISDNGLVEDPIAFEKERYIFNPWSSSEEELFIDKLAVFGKDFTKISSYLDRKTTADCVQFYYKNHKSDAFKRVKKSPGFSKHSTTTYLLTSGNRLNREANALPLDILGTASAISEKNDNMEIQQKHTSMSLLAAGSYKMKSDGDNLVDRSSSLCLFDNDREAVAADVLAGICGSLSSEAMSSCITSSLDPAEGYQDQKYQRMGSSTRRPLTPEVTQKVVETCSDDSCGEMGPTDWTDGEKTLLIEAVSSYGKDFNMISRCVRTKTHDQCKVFFSKIRKCLGLDKICPGSGNLITDDVNRGRRGACFLETGSVICNGKSGSKIDDDMASDNLKFGHDPMKVSIASVKPDLNSAQENVARDMDSTYTLTSKNLPDDQEMEDNFELVFGVKNGNGSSAEVIPDLGVPDDAVLKNSKNLPNVLETAAQSRHLNAACLTIPEAEPDVEGCLHGSSSTANGHETKETSTRCSLQDEHRGVYLASNEFLQRTLESGVEEKPILLRPASPALADQGSSISTIEHGSCFPDDASVVPEKTRVEPKVMHYKMDEQHLPRITLVEQMQSTCQVDQYPVAVSTIKEMNSDIGCKRFVPEGTNVARCLGRGFHLQRCQSREAVNSDVELAPTHEEDDSGRPSGSQPHIDKLSTNGDVILFGQILSKTSHHEPNLSARVSEGCSSSQYNSLGIESSSVKCPSSQQAVDGLSAHLKHGHKNIVDLDTPTPRNVYFPSQNRIHNGPSTLPDSTILLARYPTAFSNYLPPSSKIELKFSNGVAKSTECCLNGVSTFLNKDVSVNNGSADLHVYRNQEVQAFSLDMRHMHDPLVTPTQRRTGFDLVPRLQQQTGGMVAINVVGRGAVVGGQFVSVSDPVAAIKMHYAKSDQQQFSGGHLAANIIREDDPWRGKGSVGR